VFACVSADQFLTAPVTALSIDVSAAVSPTRVLACDLPSLRHYPHDLGDLEPNHLYTEICGVKMTFILLLLCLAHFVVYSKTSVGEAFLESTRGWHET
jgi:hypothetical protein